MSTGLAEPSRQLAVFRHAPTKKGDARGRGSHLSREGVALARRIGAALGEFHRVCASTVPRTLETAIAMGFAVDRSIDVRCGYVSGEFEHHAQWTWGEPFVRFAEILRRGGQLADAAAADARTWTELTAELPPGGRALIISHGGSIEPVAVACLPDADHATWGAPFSHCDGIVLTFSAGKFVHAEFRRASAVA